MKKYIKTFVFLISVCTIFFLTACGNSIESSIYAPETTEPISESKWKESIRVEYKDGKIITKNRIEGRIYQFFEDGTFEAFIGLGNKPSTGTWNYASEIEISTLTKHLSELNYEFSITGAYRLYYDKGAEDQEFYYFTTDNPEYSIQTGADQNKFEILEPTNSTYKQYSTKQKINYGSSGSNTSSSGTQKCINCNGTGTVKYYYGSSDLEAILSGHDPYTFGPCGMCNGTGKTN